jgi:hypothetical protein
MDVTQSPIRFGRITLSGSWRAICPNPGDYSHEIETIFVEDQRAAQGTDLQQAVPVTAVAGEARDLQSEHQSGSPQAHFSHQPLESDAVRGRGARLAQVRIDYNDLFFCPAQPQCLLPQAILALSALLMLKYLSRSRLPDIELCVAFSMFSLNFRAGVNHEIAPWWWISRTMAAIN